MERTLRIELVERHSRAQPSIVCYALDEVVIGNTNGFAEVAAVLDIEVVLRCSLEKV